VIPTQTIDATGKISQPGCHAPQIYLIAR
jgi:hypothetical protein